MKPKNRLVNETSPYLLQHADNPVDWHPWDEEALSLAKESNKPILLSIGYSACHWCHVMAHESFEDPDTAKLMNELFINIKVDREERPDLDKIYQLAHAVLTQNNGGWPLTMFLTPDQIPFFGGTYFPKKPQYDMPAFKDIIVRIAQYLEDKPDEINQQNQSLFNFFNTLNTQDNVPILDINEAPLQAVREELIKHFDEKHGGFGEAPKFPHAPSLERALRHWVSAKKEGNDDKQILHAAQFTLEQMATGGIYDQLGGGFYRYSVDDQWMIPHFEKMLYDNGPLIALYAHMYSISQNMLFKFVATESADWVRQEMQSPEGGFYSTLDADSQGEEGRYYTWEKDEVEEALDEKEFEIFSFCYGLDQQANFENCWHLYVRNNVKQISEHFKISEDEAEQLLYRANSKLFMLRERRIHPARDEKILTAWNGLMIKGMATVGRIFGDSVYTQSASQALDFIVNNLWQKKRLLASYKDGQSKYPAYLDDYAFLLEGVLELLQNQWSNSQLAFAVELADALLDYFEDKEHGGFYFTANDHEELMHRPKSYTDDAVPSGSAVAAYGLNRLGYLLGETRYINAAQNAVHAAMYNIEQSPLGHCSYLRTLEEIIHAPTIIIIRCNEESKGRVQALTGTAYEPRRLIFFIPGDEAEVHPALADKKLVDSFSAYICHGSQCDKTVTSESELTQVITG